MNEEQIEARVEKMTDRLDRRFMSGEIDQPEYDRSTREISKWADDQYDRCRP
jgi:uncharacterized membrane protein